MDKMTDGELRAQAFHDRVSDPNLKVGDTVPAGGLRVSNGTLEHPGLMLVGVDPLGRFWGQATPECVVLVFDPREYASARDAKPE